jgi:hypothetical protein
MAAGAAMVLAILGACGPDAVDDADVYPRNCGVEGPVDLFAGDDPLLLWMQPAGDRYLVERWIGPTVRELWAVDRCGEARLLRIGDSAPNMGVAGPHVLQCDKATGAMAYIDPTGVEPPRPVFESVEACRVVPVGRGLAAQSEDGTVWFDPDPADPDAEAIVVTEAAGATNPSWFSCPPMRFDCEIFFSIVGLRAVGDDLLVPLEDGSLVAFSTRSLSSRILDEGPVQQMRVLADERSLVVKRHLGPTRVVDVGNDSAVEFCCHSDLTPIRLLGEWLVTGSFLPPTSSSSEWPNLRALHLPSGQRFVHEGRETWNPFARLDADTILVDIRPEGAGAETTRTIVWPATGERQPIDLPGLTWFFPGKDGVYIRNSEDGSHSVRHLAGPDEESRLLLEDARVVFVTRDERIVFQRTPPGSDLDELWVMPTDEPPILLDDHVFYVFSRTSSSDAFLTDTDEVVYTVQHDDRAILRRTALP